MRDAINESIRIVRRNYFKLSFLIWVVVFFKLYLFLVWFIFLLNLVTLCKVIKVLHAREVIINPNSYIDNVVWIVLFNIETPRFADSLRNYLVLISFLLILGFNVIIFKNWLVLYESARGEYRSSNLRCNWKLLTFFVRSWRDWKTKILTLKRVEFERVYFSKFKISYKTH